MVERRLAPLLLFAVTLPLFASEAGAKTTIVVLDFGGSQGRSARKQLVQKLRAEHDVLPGGHLLDACEDLGLTPSRGANLASCAQQVGAAAVIGGKAANRTLSVAVYSAESGEPVVSGTLSWTRPTRSQIRQALELILSGLEQLPPPRQRLPPAATGALPPASSDHGSDGIVFEPEDVPIGDEGLPAQDEGDAFDEDPLAPPPPPPTSASPAAATEGGAEPGDRAPRAAASVGIGTWFRNFAFTDPLGTAPSYSSGAAFALRLAAQTRPLAFFLDSFPANFYARLRYQMALGLESQAAPGLSSLGTSLSELLLDVGYHWQIFDRLTSPSIDFGLGYGATDFSIDWPDPSQQNLPNVAYRFVLITVEGGLPFTRYLDGYLRIDYRLVLSQGEIVDDERWYGPASTGGIAGALGVTGNFKGFLATAEYSYTRYFFTFTDPLGRDEAGKRAAAGAVDQYHSIMLSFGYSL